MASEPFEKLVSDMARQARLLWMLMASSIAIYGGVLFFLLEKGMNNEAPPPETLQAIGLALTAAAASAGVASIVLPRILMAPKRLCARMPDPAPDEIVLPRKGRREVIDLRALAPLERKVAYVLKKDAFAAGLIGIALAESVALMGLVLGVLSREILAATPFLFVGGALVMARMPKLEALARELLREAEGQPGKPPPA